MSAFLMTLPVWVYLVAGAILAYLGYRYWKSKKAGGYSPRVVSNLSPSDFSTLRDNPTIGK